LGFVTIQLIRPARIHTTTSDAPDDAAKYILHEISKLPSLLVTL
jgi:hypothetical protein